MPVRDGPPRYCVRSGRVTALSDGHALPRLPSGANFMSRLLRSQGTEAILSATETGSGRTRAYPAAPSD